MYNSFPVWVAIIKKPLSACNKRSRSYGPFLCNPRAEISTWKKKRATIAMHTKRSCHHIGRRKLVRQYNIAPIRERVKNQCKK